MRARPLAAAMLVLCVSAPAAAQSVGAVVACTWSGPPAGDPFPNHKNVLSTPLVADLPYQSDFATEIVVVAYNGTDGGAYSSAGSSAAYFGVLRVIDGQTCQQIDTIHDSSNPIIAAAVPAIGDLDNDGVPEIVALRALAGVVAFKWNSSLSRYQTWWVSTGSTISYVNRWDGLSIHDVNNDGYAEVVSSGEVFSGRTGERLNPGNTVSFLAGVGCTPVIADVDGDGAVELVAQRVYRWTARGWQIAYAMNVVGRHFAVADFGTPGATPADFDRTQLDGVAEVVVTGQSTTASLTAISLVTLGGQVVFRKTLDGIGGPPVIADVDGDGYPEIGVSGSNTYRVFDLKAAGAADPYVKWSKPIADSSSSSAGSAGFDFDGDGAMEIVSADQCFTRIFSGSTGAVVFSAPRWSCTWSEYPVVADTNGDGFAELVVSQNSNCQPMACPGTDPNRPTVARFGAALQGIQVFRGSPAWSPVRPIWNQQAYAITNVLDDGRIPAMPAWVQNFRTVGLNNFSVNGLGVAPDTTPPIITLNGGDPMTVEVGTAFVDPGATAVDEVAGPVPVTTSGSVNTSALGTYTLSYSASDPSGNTATATRTVRVVDTRPPAIVVSVSPAVLWPPNHALVPIVATVSVSDAADPFPVARLISITSNEPDNGTGDGDTTGDIAGADVGTPDRSFALRAERAAGGAGRVYTITYEATDASGNATRASVSVIVPLSQRKK